MAANVLISALEVVSVFTESNENIKGRKSFKHIFLYTAFADDFALLRAIPSVKELINSFHEFYCFSGLKTNTEKCDITGIDSLKGVIEPVCGLKFVDLSFDTIKKL